MKYFKTLLFEYANNKSIVFDNDCIDDSNTLS